MCSNDARAAPAPCSGTGRQVPWQQCNSFSAPRCVRGAAHGGTRCAQGATQTESTVSRMRTAMAGGVREEKGAEREREGTSALVHVNVGLLADDVGETATDTLDGGHGVHHLLLAINVGTEDTQDVLEIATILDGESLRTHT